MIQYDISRTDEDLQAIQDLQSLNLPERLDGKTKKSEGFVTLQHDLSLLRDMQECYPHIVARDLKRIVGYALSMSPMFFERLPLLHAMRDQLSQLRNDEKLYANATFIVMGQICIAKQYRKKGLFRGLYNKMKAEFLNRVDFIITEVDDANKRSLNAHLGIGFELVQSYRADGRNWHILTLSV